MRLTGKLDFTIGLGQRARRRTIAASKLEQLQQEVQAAKKRFGLAETAQVVSCYEAGREGFWLARYHLCSQGIENVVVDASSIEVNRRAKRVKTDRLDVGKLLTMLIRYHHGEQKVWHVVQVPTPQQEDRRQLHREMLALKRERTRHINRIKGLLASQGVRLAVNKQFLSQLEAGLAVGWFGLAGGLAGSAKARSGSKDRRLNRLSAAMPHSSHVTSKRAVSTP